MKLNDLIDALNFGELSQLRIGGESTEGITEGNVGRLVPHINMGLTALHSRFRLREGRRTVTLTPGLEVYRLASAEGQGRVLQIERVLWPEGLEALPGNPVSPELPMDLEGASHGVFRVASASLRVPQSLQDQGVTQLEVVVREDHPPLQWEPGFFYPEEIEVDIPANYTEALTYFVASRLINPIGVSGVRGDFHEGNNYAAKFEDACRRLEQGGYTVQSHAEENRFSHRGWV